MRLLPNGYTLVTDDKAPFQYSFGINNIQGVPVEYAFVAAGIVFLLSLILFIIVQPSVLQLSTAMCSGKYVSWGRSLGVVVMATVANYALACGLGWTGIGFFASFLMGIGVWAFLIASVLEIDIAVGLVISLVMTVLNWGLSVLALGATGVTFAAVASVL